MTKQNSAIPGPLSKEGARPIRHSRSGSTLIALALLSPYAAATPSTHRPTPADLPEQRVVRKNIPVPDGARIEIHHSTGPIRLSSHEVNSEDDEGAGSSLRFRATFEAIGTGAERFVEEAEIHIETGPDRVSLDTWYPKRDDPLSFETVLDVSVPRGHNIDVTNAFGQVDASDVFGSLSIRADNGQVAVRGGRGDLRVDGSFGDLQVHDRQGHLRAKVQNGDLSVTSIVGDATVECAFGAAELREITGRLKVHCETARLHVRDIGGSVESEGFASSQIFEQIQQGLRVRAQTGEVEARQIKGPVEIDANFGAARLEAIRGTVRIQGRTLIVHVHDVIGNVESNTRFRDVTFEDVVGDCRIEHRSAPLTIHQVRGTVETVTRYAPIRISSVEGPIDARGESTDMEISGTGSADHPIVAHTTFGGISLTLPLEAPVRIDARTSLGEIGSTIPLKIRKPYVNEQHGTGSQGAGTREITLNVESGGIQIRTEEEEDTGTEHENQTFKDPKNPADG